MPTAKMCLASKGNLRKVRKFFSRTRQEADSEKSIELIHVPSKLVYYTSFKQECTGVGGELKVMSRGLLKNRAGAFLRAHLI